MRKNWDRRYMVTRVICFPIIAAMLVIGTAGITCKDGSSTEYDGGRRVVVVGRGE